jgi:hypothetical protein
MLSLLIWWTLLSVVTAVLLGAFLDRGHSGSRHR